MALARVDEILFVILAIGESVFAIGAGAAGQPLSAPLLVAAVLGIAAALCLWWLYFDVVSRAAEHRLRDAQGQARVRMAIEVYSYGHFPIVLSAGADFVTGQIIYVDGGSNARMAIWVGLTEASRAP